ncbi:hypothetical protein E3A20_11950 [Planctomyces bekefii]|uniref:PPM-type phosphatase domain-containing protein n=1 Tax=Planctomyces bekefii TaxID=1653850 RepID=A0A5C6M4M2_9PLAN|nr:hypothetical protein E3A20_11950 [Planctomyces bekefii]
MKKRRAIETGIMELNKAETRMGHALAGIIVLIFSAVFGASIYRLDFWQKFLFSDATVVDVGCKVGAKLSKDPDPASPIDSLEMVPVKLPHANHLPNGASETFRNLVKAKPEADDYFHVRYLCHIGPVATKPDAGIMYLHLGWIVSEQARILLNGKEILAFQGADKVSLPLSIAANNQTSGDAKKSPFEFDLEILATAKNPDFLGLISNIPVSLQQGTKGNIKIFGLETAVDEMRPLYKLLPTLTLGMVLTFAWFFRRRTKLLITTFHFFALSIISSSLTVLADFLPLPIIKIFYLIVPFMTGSMMSFALYGFEVFDFKFKWTFRLQLAVWIFVAVEFIAVLIHKSPNPDWCLHVHLGSSILLLMVTIFVGHRKIPSLESTDRFVVARAKVHRFFLSFCWLVLLALLAEAAQRLLNLQIRLFTEQYAQLVMPFFVGGVLLYSLSLMEDSYHDEKSKRSKIEGELSLAAKLQGILLPKELQGKIGSWAYHIESTPHGILGGDWVKVHKSERGALLAIGDVVGKGPSAALTHSGIAAAWESQIRAWDSGQVTSEELLQAVNRTMFDLFGGTMNTTFAIAEIDRNGDIFVAAGGNYWLHLSHQKSKPITSDGRSLLGIKPDFSVKMTKVELAKGDWLVCFTDGIVEGNRAISRFLKVIQPQFSSLTAVQIPQLLREAGKDQVHPDDASILVMQYNSELSELDASRAV